MQVAVIAQMVHNVLNTFKTHNLMQPQVIFAIVMMDITYDLNKTSGLCLPCNSFCKTCNGHSIINCLTCQQFWDFSQHQCVDCSDFQSVMLIMLKFDNGIKFLCLLIQLRQKYLQLIRLQYSRGSSLYNQLCNKYGYYYGSSQGQCLSYSQFIKGICGDPSKSSVCKQNRWVYESLSRCISCDVKQSPLCCNSTCQTCNCGSANNCLSCYGSMILFNSTSLEKCPNRYIYNAISNGCQTFPVFVGVCYASQKFNTNNYDAILQIKKIKNNTATIVQGDTLNFLPNVLKFKINSNSSIDTFLNDFVQKFPQNTGVVFIYTKIENSCNDYKITLDKVLNDSGRGFKKITILSQATSQSFVNITIPKGVITLNTQKTIQLQYQLKNTYSGTQQFLFQVATFKSLGVQTSTDMTVPFYRYQNFRIMLLYSIQYYDSKGISLNANDPVDIQMTSPQTKLILRILQSKQLQIQLQLSSDAPVTNNQQLSFASETPNLMEKQQDLDAQDSNAYQGIALTWSCTDPSDPTKQCLDQSGNHFIINSNNPQILPDTFNPFSVARVQVQGKKDSQSSQDFIIVLFTEFDLPLLDVQLGLTDPLSTTLWEHYSSFNRQNASVTIGFSVFNPYYFIPRVSIISLRINFPPQQYVFNIKPLPNSSNFGKSLQALFTVTMLNCIDDNLPIQYQFFMYKSSDDMKDEIKNPYQVVRRQLNDLSQNSSKQAILPIGNLVIMATTTDSKEAVYNTTIIISLTNSNLNEVDYLTTIDKVLSSKEYIINKLFQSFHLQQKIYAQGRIYLQMTISSLISTIKLTSDQQVDQLKNLQTDLSEDWSQVPYQSLSITEKSQRNQQIHDYFRIVDNMANSTQSQISSVSDLQINNLKNFVEKMNYNALPNEGSKIFQSSSLKLQSQIISEKNLCKYLFCTYYIPSVAQNKPIFLILDIKLAIKIPIQMIKAITLQIQQNIGNQTIAQFPVINPTITTSSTPQPGSLINTSNYVLTFQASQQQQGLACFTKAKNQWTQTVVSLYLILGVLLENKNLQTAFGEQGFNNISHFTEFYKYIYIYIAFWLIVFETFGFLFLFLKGRLLDKIYEKQQKIFSDVNKNKIFSLNQNPLKDNNHIFSDTQQQQKQSQQQQCQQEQQSEQQEKEFQKILLTEVALDKPDKKIQNVNSLNYIRSKNQENYMEVAQTKKEKHEKQLSQNDVLQLDSPKLDENNSSFQNLENLFSQRQNSNPQNKTQFSQNLFKKQETNVINLDTQAQNQLENNEQFLKTLRIASKHHKQISLSAKITKIAKNLMIKLKKLNKMAPQKQKSSSKMQSY
ncbi:hypothetical protein ABPG72_017280 [Tetrahymena utriculariae]